LTASECGISLSPVPKKLARASDTIAGSWFVASASAGGLGSSSTGFSFFKSRFESSAEIYIAYYLIPNLNYYGEHNSCV
jgi:hypothetical protein